jgi:hypothetical protein
MPPLFALDQGFPQPIVEALADYLAHQVRLVPLASIDEWLTADIEDWEILLALYHHAEPWDGLVTTDEGMLVLPRELSVLLQTRVSLVVVREAGHDPVMATGILLAQISGVCNRTTRDHPQLWKLGTTEKRPDNPWDDLAGIARHHGRTPAEIFAEHQLARDELARDPLADDRDGS